MDYWAGEGVGEGELDSIRRVGAGVSIVVLVVGSGIVERGFHGFVCREEGTG